MPKTLVAGPVGPVAVDTGASCQKGAGASKHAVQLGERAPTPTAEDPPEATQATQSGKRAATDGRPSLATKSMLAPAHESQAPRRLDF